MSEIDRLYRYQTLLQARRVVPRSEFLHVLEISLATFKRDLAKLRDRLNVPIVFDSDLGGYRLDRSQDSTELPGFWFSHQELLALLTLNHMIEQLEPSLLGPKLQPLRQRLHETMQQQGLDPAQLSQRVRAVHAGKRNMPLQSFEHVAQATFERRQLLIVHRNRQARKTSQRTISPQQLVHYRDNWYVDAWCHLRQGVRSFAIDAIERAQVLPDAATELDLATMRQQLDGGYGIFAGAPKDWAVIRFSATRADWVAHENWHPHQLGTLNPDGTYTLQVPYSDERELLADVLRFGADAHIIEPLALRARAQQELQAMAKQYG